MLGDLENESLSLVSSWELDIEGVKDRWEVVVVEVNVDNGTDNGLDGTGLEVGWGSVRSGSGDYGNRGQRS